MPVLENALQKKLLLDPKFHWAFVQGYGYDTWIEFVRGNEIHHSGDPFLKVLPVALPFQIRIEGVDDPVVQQTLIQWEPVGQLTPDSVRKGSSTILLDAGDTLEEFVDNFSGLFAKFDLKGLKRILEGENYNDDPHFPGVADFPEEAESLLKRYLAREGVSTFALYLRTGYRGEDSLRDFTSFVLNDEREEGHYTKDEERRRVEIRNALEDGLDSAYRDAYRDGETSMWVSQVKGMDFHNSSLVFDGREWGSWEVTIEFNDLVNFLIKSMRYGKDNFGEPIVSEDTIKDWIFDAAPFVEPQGYPDVEIGNHMDYAHDRFSEAMKELGVLEKGLR